MLSERTPTSTTSWNKSGHVAQILPANLLLLLGGYPREYKVMFPRYLSHNDLFIHYLESISK
ncbi:unnamed protein product [Acanthoscelides obtectus]|uniref:Uncharacterized protein n=1 Tax=Acanthoscelides obtectus TaxID=200917 RepID=A0A9P0LAC4_ACAOB|nr:unnamed protein product [Acanthoscelides obtectus]CAK1635937.1 hypothetical protein AOBTE_LOCUS9639 [Acanthoscelides obtectus]